MLYLVALPWLEVLLREERLRCLWLWIAAILDRTNLVDSILNDYLVVMHAYS